MSIFDWSAVDHFTNRQFHNLAGLGARNFLHLDYFSGHVPGRALGADRQFDFLT